MTTPTSVSGVLGVCRVGCSTLHSAKPRITRAAGHLCKVCKVRAHARARQKNFLTIRIAAASFFPYARTKKPYQPYTPYTHAFKALILFISRCVGSVLGWLEMCRVAIGGRWQ